MRSQRKVRADIPFTTQGGSLRAQPGWLREVTAEPGRTDRGPHDGRCQPQLGIAEGQKN